MSFLDEVNSLKQKTGITKPKIPIVLGLGVCVLAIVAFCGFQLWNAFSTPAVSVYHNSEQQISEQGEQTEGSGSSTTAETKVFVHVTGEVAFPGIYELPSGSRVSEAIEAAGGLTEKADDTSINLARSLTDGEQIIVATHQEGAPQTSASQGNTGQGNAAVRSGTGKININTASTDELMELDGVGEATAEKIIAYRQEHGSFSTIEEIKEVSGIGDKKFEAMKDSITV